MNVLLSAYVHRRDKMRRQFMFVFHDVSRSRIYRFLITLVHVNSQRLRGERVHVSARAERVFTNVSPGEVWLDTGRRLRHQRNRSGWRNRRHFVVARRQRNIFRNSNLVVKKLRVSFAIRFKLRETPLSPRRDDCFPSTTRAEQIPSPRPSDRSTPANHK